MIFELEVFVFFLVDKICFLVLKFCFNIFFLVFYLILDNSINNDDLCKVRSKCIKEKEII